MDLRLGVTPHEKAAQRVTESNYEAFSEGGSGNRWAVNSPQLPTCPFSLRAFCFWRVQMNCQRQDGDELMEIIKNMILALPDDRYNELVELMLEIQDAEKELDPERAARLKHEADARKTRVEYNIIAAATCYSDKPVK